MSYLHGKDLTVHYAQGDTYKSVAAARSCEIKIGVEMQETAGPHTGTHKTYVPGRISWSVRCGGLMKTDGFQLFQLMAARRSLTLYFRNEDGGKMLCGEAYLTDLQKAGEVHGIATYSATFTGTGELTEEDI